MRKTFTTILAAGMLAIIGAQAPALAGGQATNDVRVEARLEGNTLASGKSVYREKTRGSVMQQRFKVQVEDFAPGETLTIMLNGQMFGTVTANDLGIAELQFRTSAFIDEPGDGDPIGEFPPILPGDTISVGPISGTFESR